MTATCAALLLGVMLCAAPPRVAAADFSMTAAESQFLTLLNADRQASGLPALLPDPELSRVARERSWQLLPLGAVSEASHLDRAGNPVVTTLLNRDGFAYALVGENLVENNYPETDSPSVAEAGLMRSPIHRGNILYPDYDRVGIGIAGPGPDGELYYTQVFAKIR